MNKKIETTHRILDCAITLMGKKGYNPVTIREIALEAQCSEMTVFRHYPTKSHMLAAALRRTSYEEMLNTLFTTEIRWQLEYDLRLIMEKYFVAAEQRKEILLIYFSALSQVGENQVKINTDVTLLQNNLKKYFEEMQKRGKIHTMDATYLASLFWHMIAGYFMTRIVFKSTNFVLEKELYIANAVLVFAGGMRKIIP